MPQNSASDQDGEQSFPPVHSSWPVLQLLNRVTLQLRRKFPLESQVVVQRNLKRCWSCHYYSYDQCTGFLHIHNLHMCQKVMLYLQSLMILSHHPLNLQLKYPSAQSPPCYLYRTNYQQISQKAMCPVF